MLVNKYNSVQMVNWLLRTKDMIGIVFANSFVCGCGENVLKRDLVDIVEDCIYMINRKTKSKHIYINLFPP